MILNTTITDVLHIPISSKRANFDPFFSSQLPKMRKEEAEIWHVHFLTASKAKRVSIHFHQENDEQYKRKGIHLSTKRNI